MPTEPSGNPERVVPARRLRNKEWVPAALVTAIVIAGITLYSATQKRSAPMPPPRPQTVLVGREDIEETILVKGKLEAAQVMDVGLPAAGEVIRLNVEIGDTVKAGDLLADVKPAIAPARIEATRTELARLKAEFSNEQAQYEFADLQFQRQTQLKRENATREDAFESSRMNVQSATARLEAMRAQIRQTELTLKTDELLQGQTRLLAPLSGTIIALDVHQGQVLSAPQTGLMRIANLTTMIAWAQVPEVDITRLRPGMMARIATPGYPGRQWKARLRKALPAPVRNADHGDGVYYPALFDLTNPKHELMSGMSATMTIVLAQAADVTAVPIAAIRSAPVDPPNQSARVAPPQIASSGTAPSKLLASGNPQRSDRGSPGYVQVLSADGQVVSREIRTGIRSTSMAQVLEGLAPGEHVVVAGP